MPRELRPSRRALLLAAGAAALAGCTGRSAPPRPTPAPVDPDEALREAARTREAGLVAAHEAAVAARPELAARLAPLLAHHREHLAALGGTSSPAPTGSAPAGAGASTAPGTRPSAATALARLRAAEAAAGTAALRTLPAASPRLRPLLASVGACEAAHAALLEVPA
ncbi:hypothetical protein CLV35_1077 [Motilibacter peucedani]|uniref:Lipoprotein n=1 Tax=Motilibacter peucedani TaxID=598650 RepID=A0A420XRF6_9ACTN|nr:hypothetical protein [Motilibacter peucedani]RKS77391.1 hypothetical protein CLV35_1077 [Motilibacter peucedani]